MSVAPNGVTIADYDLTGIGVVVFAAIDRADWTADVAFGDVVDGDTVNLRPAGIMDYTDGTNQVIPNTTALSGGWKCLGHLNLGNVNVGEVATLFMRVS